MPLPKSNPRRIPRAMEAEPEALGNATWSENNINTNGPVIALASNMNTWAKQVSDNVRFVRETGWMVYDFQTGPLAGPNCALFGVGLHWQPQIGLSQVTEGDIFYANGKRIDLYTQSILDGIGQTNHTFPPSTTVWVYASGRYLETTDQLGGQGTPNPFALPQNVDLYFDDVGQGNPPNPPAGYLVVGGVLTNAIGIAASYEPFNIPPPYTLQSGLAISLPFLLDGDLTVTGNLTVQGAATFNATLNATGVSTFSNNVTMSGNFVNFTGTTVEFNNATTEINSQLLVTGLSFFNANSFFVSDSFFEDKLTITGLGELILTPIPSPGLTAKGRAWVQTVPSTGLFFTDDNTVAQQVWATPSGMSTRKSVADAFVNLIFGGVTNVITKALNIPANMSALVVAKMDLRLQDGDGANSNHAVINVKKDGFTIATSTFFVGSFTSNSVNSSVVSWCFCDYVSGPVTNITIEGTTTNNNGNLVQAGQTKLTMLGTIPTANIL